jgi:hypothetical protein
VLLGLPLRKQLAHKPNYLAGFVIFYKFQRDETEVSEVLECLHDVRFYHYLQAGHRQLAERIERCLDFLK